MGIQKKYWVDGTINKYKMRLVNKCPSSHGKAQKIIKWILRYLKGRV